MQQDKLLEILQEGRDFVTQRPSNDCLAVNIPQEHLLEYMQCLRDKMGLDLLVDATAIDWGLEAETRYTVVYHLLHSTKHYYLRVASDCKDNDFPKSPSMAHLWPAADWHERETYDMFGIEYENHPNLKRILMWDGYEHHPLRRDFPLAGVETDLPADDVAKATDAKVKAAPMMGGPFKASCGGSMKFREPSAKDESWTEKQEKPTIEG